MEIKSTDNAYMVNQKLKNVLNTEDEKQYLITEKYYVPRTVDNYDLNKSDKYGSKISFANNELCSSEDVKRIFMQGKMYDAISFPIEKDRVYSFDEKLSKTFCSIIFIGEDNIIYNSDTVIINNICLPEKIDNFKFMWTDTTENNEVIGRKLIFGEIDINNNFINGIEINVPPNKINDDGTEEYYVYTNGIKLVFDRGGWKE